VGYTKDRKVGLILGSLLVKIIKDHFNTLDAKRLMAPHDHLYLDHTTEKLHHSQSARDI
jgi:hypothetical protein